MKLRDLMSIADTNIIFIEGTGGEDWEGSPDNPVPYRLREKKVIEMTVGDECLYVRIKTDISRHYNTSNEKENITMQDLIKMYIYYDRMTEYYEMKPLVTETDVAKYHQFKKLRDAVGREIEVQM